LTVKNIFALVGFTMINIATQAQFVNVKNYPQGYFMYPVKSAIGLNANFGELRPNHWHMGLDCKTEKRENIDILAAADGYVAKIKIEPFGFGRAIYINHPNGFQTLYAHLNDFYPELEKWVKEQQYLKKSWKVYLDSIPANLFVVKKGQFIAKSGNAGGSQGPHLHFEIRETKSEKVLNPLLFGFNIPDNVKPKINKVVVYDRCQSVYEQNARIIAVNGATAAPINIKTEQVSFAISATDAVSGSDNPNGIYEATIYDNEKPICGFQLDSIGYDETRYLNAHIDYKMKAKGGSFVQHLSELPGYPNGVYKKFNGDGVINLMDGMAHNIKIIVKDAAGNATTLNFAVINKDIANTRCQDSVNIITTARFFPNLVNVFDHDDIFFYTQKNTLYDSINFKYGKTGGKFVGIYSDVHQVHVASVPMHSYFTMNLKSKGFVPDADKQRMIIKRLYGGGKFDAVKATLKGEWYSANFRGFGDFVLIYDGQPPTITPVGIKNGANLSKAKGFSFVIKDENEEIKNFSATIDGQWLLFSNDKGKVFKHVFDEKTTLGPHELKLYVEDEAGNATEQIYNFTR
jgi:murein DD-endopeptidase MepM/ murein hydrolase activator NlpD